MKVVRVDGVIVAVYVLGHNDGFPLEVDTESENPVKAAPEDG